MGDMKASVHGVLVALLLGVLAPTWVVFSLAAEAAESEHVLGTILTGEPDPLFDEGYVPEAVETASFAMGCFWGADGLFGILPGVIRTRVGYAGGTTRGPSYYGIGDHAEAIQVDFDPSIITYDKLLELFAVSHDPYAPAYSTQYRSLILYHTEGQRQTAEAWIDRETAENGIRPLTEIVPFRTFTRAEGYHQKYHLQTDGRVPLVMAELLGEVENFDAFVDSTVAARLNGYLAGWATRGRLEREIGAFGLSEEAQAEALAATAP